MNGATVKAAESTWRIGVIPGDGVGREVIPVAQRVLAAALEQTGRACIFLPLEAGWKIFQQTGAALPPDTLTALRTCQGALFGAVSSPSGRVAGYSSPIIGLRRALDLYANLRPVCSAPVTGSRDGVDLLVVRENTECLYVKQEQLSDDGETATAQRVITRTASARIAQMAFAQARRRARARVLAGLPQRTPMVTVVHKANVLSVSDGLFRSTALAVAADYPDVTVEEQLVDSMVYRLIREPQRYDVVVAPNLYGDILSDAAAALAGGLGLAPSANVGDGFVLAEPVHGSAPDIAGRGVANPLAAVLAAAQLAAALGDAVVAGRLSNAVDAVLATGPHTPDLGGDATTAAVEAALLGQLHPAV